MFIYLFQKERYNSREIIMHNDELEKFDLAERNLFNFN